MARAARAAPAASAGPVSGRSSAAPTAAAIRGWSRKSSVLPASNRTALSGTPFSTITRSAEAKQRRQAVHRFAGLALVDHVDVHPLAEGLLDRVVDHVEHRRRLALAAALAL